MFTGIVEATGRIIQRNRSRLVVEPRAGFKGVSVGESVSVDGVCLTADQVNGRRISFRLLPETVRVSTLGTLRAGDSVNLERALLVGDRLGGHLLLGHVDGQATVTARTRAGDSLTMELQLPAHLAGALVPKGPIALHGVSLTLDAKVEKERIRVHLVAQTLRRTTLGSKIPGSRVNLEVDLIAKYLWGML